MTDDERHNAASVPPPIYRVLPDALVSTSRNTPRVLSAFQAMSGRSLTVAGGLYCVPPTAPLPPPPQPGTQPSLPVDGWTGQAPTSTRRARNALRATVLCVTDGVMCVYKMCEKTACVIVGVCVFACGDDGD